MNQLTVDVNGGANAGAAFGAAQQLQAQQPMQVGGSAGDWSQNGTMFYYQPTYVLPQPNYYGRPHRCPNCGRCPCCGR